MNEKIGRPEREPLRRFFLGLEADTLLISALEGRTGWAFESRDGSAAMVYSRGFVFLGGQAREGFFRRAAERLPGEFLTFSGSPAWLRIAARWGADIPMTRYRLASPRHFDRDKLRHLAAPPAGFSLMAGDADTYRACRAEKWSEDLVKWYPDGEAMAREGLMTAACRDGVPVAGCGVYARTDTGVEIEIDTREDMRRLGLARCCAAAFLLRCEERGLTPHWDAMTSISRDLALQLGFADPVPYRVVCREEIGEKNR